MVITSPTDMTLKNRKKLFDCNDIYNIKETHDLFLLAMQEVVEYHIKNCNFYQKMLQRDLFDPKSLQTSRGLEKLPILHANFFKTHELLSIPRDAVTLHLTSSGTSGQKSQMFFDKESWDAGETMVRNTMDAIGFISKQQTNYLLYTYESTSQSNLGTAHTDLLLTSFAPANRIVFALLSNGTGHDFDIHGCIRALYEFEKENLPVRILGFPSFLYFTLKKMRERNLAPIKLPPGSSMLLGGGWKGQAHQQISKKELYHMVQEQLGIQNELCRDGYGSVEHSVPYIECKNHHFHVPIWSRVIIRDVKTLNVLGYHQPGFLNFVSPHLLSVPAVSVLMNDLATLHPPDQCGCGIPTPYFKVLGRAGTSISKSCAVSASELLGR